MNKRFLLALGLAAFCGLLAILVAQQYLAKEIAKKRELSDEYIVAAAVDIPFGTKITAEQLKTIPYRRDQKPLGAFTNLNEVVGRLALTTIIAQTPVLPQHVAKEGQASNLLTDKLREGMRAVSVRVDEASSVAGFAVPGNYVDIIAVLNPGGGARPVSKVILQNIRILANGRQTQARTDGKETTSNTVTLEVTPGQGETLKLAEREGTLQLMLRSTSDTALQPTPGASTSDVIDERLVKSATPRQPRASDALTAYIPPLPVAWPAMNAADAQAAKASKSASPAASPSPLPKAYTIEIVEGGKWRTVQVNP